jgi:hypothetical protein
MGRSPDLRAFAQIDQSLQFLSRDDDPGRILLSLAIRLQTGDIKVTTWIVVGVILFE